MTLELYHHGSSACAAKVRLALAEKGLEWTGHYVDLLRGEQFDPAYLAINPKAVVPALVHDGAIVRESTVICEYLDEVFDGPALYPADPLARAAVRIWTKAVDEELHPACSALTYIVSHRHAILRNGPGTFEEFLAKGAGEGTTARRRKWAWIVQGLEAPGADEAIRLYDGYLHKLESALERSEWLVANQYSMADIAMAPYLFRLQSLSMSRLWEGGRLARVENWYGRLSERPAFRRAIVEWMPEDVAADMRANGEREWQKIAVIVGL